MRLRRQHEQPPRSEKRVARTFDDLVDYARADFLVQTREWHPVPAFEAMRLIVLELDRLRKEAR